MESGKGERPRDGEGKEKCVIGCSVSVVGKVGRKKTKGEEILLVTRAYDNFPLRIRMRNHRIRYRANTSYVPSSNPVFNGIQGGPENNTPFLETKTPQNGVLFSGPLELLVKPESFRGPENNTSFQN